LPALLRASVGGAGGRRWRAAASRQWCRWCGVLRTGAGPAAAAEADHETVRWPR